MRNVIRSDVILEPRSSASLPLSLSHAESLLHFVTLINEFVHMDI